MPRKPRVFLEGALYHVYNRTSRGEPVFKAEVSVNTFVGLLRLVAERNGLSVYAWCIMPNHYHVVCRSGPVPLSRTFGVVQGRFGQMHNRFAGTRGPLWESRYKAKLVEEESYLYQLIGYVHLNPVAAGLVEDPARWTWSGHREILGRVSDPMVDLEATLAMYGDSAAAARRSYTRTLRSFRDGAWIGEDPGALPWWSSEPDRPVEMPVPLAWIDERGVSSGLERPKLEAEGFLIAVGDLMGVTPKQLASNHRGSALTHARWMLACLAIERWGQSPSRLASLLGRHPDVVTRWARRGVDLRQMDRGFADAVDILDRRLAKWQTREASVIVS